jgi:hypothetical protein
MVRRYKEERERLKKEQTLAVKTSTEKLEWDPRIAVTKLEGNSGFVTQESFGRG